MPEVTGIAIVADNPNVDFIIRGEGEKPFVEFLKLLLKQGITSDSNK